MAEKQPQRLRKLNMISPVLRALYPPVAQLDNAADSDSEEQGFESLRAGQKRFIFCLPKDEPFQLNPSCRTGEIHLRWVKSPPAVKSRFAGCRTDLISPGVKRSISPEGIARRFHRGIAAISLFNRVPARFFFYIAFSHFL